MNKRVLVLIAFLAFFGLGSAHAQIKVAYVDADSVLKALPETAVKQKELENYAKVWQTTLDEKRADYEKKVKEIQDGQNTLPPVILQQKAKDAEDLRQSLLKEEQTAQADVAKQEQILLGPLLKRIREGIDKTAKDNGYSFVLPANVLLYADKQHDITNKVILALGGKVE
ncbi:MAG: OmpH family outer membrane protein [Flammeovirgaceae bacterium]